jgi:hypothetical protein
MRCGGCDKPVAAGYWKGKGDDCQNNSCISRLDERREVTSGKFLYLVATLAPRPELVIREKVESVWVERYREVDASAGTAPNHIPSYVFRNAFGPIDSMPTDGPEDGRQWQPSLPSVCL